MMRAAVLRAVITQSWARPGRQLLVGLVVLVATAFAAASAMLTGAAGTTIVRELSGTPPAAALVVQADRPPDPLPPGALEQARQTPGAAAVAAFESGAVAVSRPGAPGDGEVWTAVTADDGPLGRFPAVTGRLPAQPREAAISEEAARRTGLAVGDRFSLVGTSGVADDLQVTGIVRARAQALSTVALPPELVTQLTGAGPSQLDVQPAAGASTDQLRTALATALGGGVQVRDAAQVRSAELTAAFGGGLTGIFAVLGVFGVTAAVAAMLTTFCVFGVTVTRQRRGVLLLRGVGATRGQVLRALLVNAVLTGLVAGILGLALSLLLVQAVRLAVSVGLGEQLPTPAPSLPLVLACLAGAVLTTLAAAVGPAVRLSGQRPAAVTAPEVATRQISRKIQRAAAAAALALSSASACGLAVTDPDQQRALVLVVLGGALAFGAVLAAGPALLPGIAWLLGAAISPLAQVPGRIAMHSARHAPRRAATMSATLVLASLLLSVVLVGLHSLTLSVQDRLAARYPAPVLVQSAGNRALPDDLAARVTELAESGAVTAVETATMTGTDGKRVTFSAVDPKAFPPLLAGAVDAGSLADLGPGRVALDRAQAAAWQVTVGSPLTFAAPGGPIELEVVAIYRSSGVLQPATVSPPDLPRIAADGSGADGSGAGGSGAGGSGADGSGADGNGADGIAVREVLVDPAPGVSVDALRGAVARLVGPDPAVQVLTPADFRAQLARAVTLTRVVAIGLVAATVLVAVCGVAVGLALSIRERHRESTTLRALGLTRGQIVAAIGLESGLLGLAGVLVGTLLGLGLGALAVYALRERAVLPLDSVLIGAGVLVLLASAAAMLPAARTARRSPVPATAD